MKKILLIGPLLLSLSLLNAQQLTIRQGMELDYTFFPMGQVFPCTITLDTTAQGDLSIRYRTPEGRGGKYIVTRASRDSGSIAFWGPPAYGQEVTLDPEQTLFIISKKQWEELQKNNSVIFDGFLYTRKEIGGNEMVVNGMPLDAIYLQSESGTRIWVLNNAEIPLLLKVEKNPFGVDIQVERVKE